MKTRNELEEVAQKLQRIRNGLAGARPCGCGGLHGAGETVGLDLVPDAVKQWCAEKAGEYVWNQYGPFLVLGGGLLVWLAWRGVRCRASS